MASSKIQWTDATWNPVVGCTPVSPGCLNCYAATMALRLEGMGTRGYTPRTLNDGRTVRIAENRGGPAVFTGDVRLVEEALTTPLRWRKPRMVFVNSMSDLFHESVPFEFIDRVFAVMALCPKHTFQILTKRPGRMREYIGRCGLSPRRGGPTADQVQIAAMRIRPKWSDEPDHVHGDFPPPNVWLGVSVERQEEADARVPVLIDTPAAVRFLSVEPLLGPVDLRKWLASGLLHQAIVGCESRGAHTGRLGMHNEAWHEWFGWAAALAGQCEAHGVAFFGKQIPDPANPKRLLHDPDERWPEALRVRQWPGEAARA